MEKSHFDADLLIAGGSTAGLATAIYARLAGLRCFLVEPRSGAMDKACGEGLMPAAVAALEEMGIDHSAMHRLDGIRYVDRDKIATCRFPDGPGIGIRRTELHAVMLKRATELGAETIKAKVNGFCDRGTHVEVAGKVVRFLVGCDGLKSRVRSLLGQSHGRRRPLRFGLRQHYQMQAQSFVEVYWQQDFELYVTPVSRDVVNIAVLFERGRPFKSFLKEVPALYGRLGEALSPVLGAGPFEQERFVPESGRVYLVGDAAGFLDPITGEGNFLAMAAARTLVSCIADGNPQQYHAKYFALTRDYWVLTSLLLSLSRCSSTRSRIVPTLHRYPRLFSFVLSRLSSH